MKPKIRSKAEALAALRQKISHLETFQPLAGKAHPRLQIPDINQHLPLGSFSTGAIHEFVSKGFEDGAATEGFVSGLISLINPKTTLLWITKRRTIFPPGLTVFGIDQDRVIFIELPGDQEILWATEEALRCQSITAVIAVELDRARNGRLENW